MPPEDRLGPGIVVAGTQFGKHIRKNFLMESSEEAADCWRGLWATTDSGADSTGRDDMNAT